MRLACFMYPSFDKISPTVFLRLYIKVILAANSARWRMIVRIREVQSLYTPFSVIVAHPTF